MSPALSLFAREAVSDVCTTPFCHTLGNDLVKYVNFNVDPCSDFFEYTCGGWVNSEPVKSRATGYNIFSQNEDDSLQHILVYLNGTFEDLSKLIQTDDASYHTQDKVETDKNNFLIAKYYYESCLDDDTRQSLGATPIFPIIAEIQNSFFPNDKSVSPENIAKALATSTLNGIQTIFSLDRELNPADHDYNIVCINKLDYKVASSSSSSISLLYYRAELTETLRQILGGESFENKDYKTLVEQESRINNITLWSPSRIQDAITNFLEFQDKLSTIESSIERNNCGSKTIPKNKTEVDNNPGSAYMRSIDSLTINSKHIDWDLFFDSMVSPTYFSGNSSVIYSIQHLTEVDKLIGSTPSEVLQDYWTIQTAVQMFPRIKFPPVQEDIAIIENSPEPYFDPAYTNDPEENMSQIICGTETSKTFYNIIGRFFALSIFGASKEKEEADRFVENIYQTWLDALPSTAWLDNSTKAKAIEKIEALRIKVAYSTSTLIDWRDPSSIEAYYTGISIGDDYFSNYYSTLAWKNHKLWKALEKKIEKDAWSEDSYPEEINAFYALDGNFIEIPIGNFRHPFYSLENPGYLNYGNLGATVGHELTHSLDSSGRFFDSQGYVSDWFSEASSQEYNKKAQCFIDQFNNFSLSIGSDADRIHLDGSNVLGENIADSGGLSISFNAYHNYLKKAGVVEKTLPGFENLTPDQLFFISNGISTCSTVQKSEAEDLVKTDVHAPFYFRNIGSFQNSAQFAKAFNCPVGSPMNPEVKCSIW